MNRSIKFHSQNILKLGKAAAREDKRNFKLTAFLKALPPRPEAWDFDAANPAISIPTPTFGNNVYRNCVIAGRAHQTLRFEALEQKKAIPITDQDVLREYWREKGGVGRDFDTGLAVLDSLKLWRKQGWRAARRTYFIHAFAQVDHTNRTEVKAALYLLTGAGAGLRLPLSAKNQFAAGAVWDVTRGPGSTPGSWGGHYVYLCGYTSRGPVCITWGRKHQMTWAFLAEYCDELYAIADNRDRFVKDSPVDMEKLEQYLSQLG